MDLVSIIMPCYKSGPYVARAVQSVLLQTYSKWELIIVSDDGQDYEEILRNAGFGDNRIKILFTNKMGSGPGMARNVGIDAAEGDILAFLDSDDEFMPAKLEYCIPAVGSCGLVSCGLKIYDEDGIMLREAGTGGKDGFFKPRDYKFINVSTDTLVLIDRRKIHARYADQSLEDLDFVLRCFEYTDCFYHCAAPLQKYYKINNSLSHKASTHAKYKSAKENMLHRLRAGNYKFMDINATPEIMRFLQLSLLAEDLYWQAKKDCPRILFEDVLEDILASHRERRDMSFL